MDEAEGVRSEGTAGRQKYDHILEIRIDYRKNQKKAAEDGEKIEVPDPFEAFGLFYEAALSLSDDKRNRGNDVQGD